MPPKALKYVHSDKYSKRWQKAKAKFKKDTGVKYPTTTKALTLWGQQMIKWREGLGIEKALKAIQRSAKDDKISITVLRGQNPLLLARGQTAVADALQAANAARVWIDQQRVNPSAANFNLHIQTLARNITQNIANIDRYKQM